jgi:hypothetical protein
MKYIKPYQLFESAESLWRVAPSSIHGQGCFAIVDLPAETDLGLLHTILPDGYDHTELGHMYNHSTTPNCYNKKIGDQRFLVTIRPVKAGEELTADYRLQPDLEQPQPDWIGESQEIGWKEWCTIPKLGRFLAKLDTGNGTKASSLGVDSIEVDGDQVYWSCNGVDRQDPIKDWSHAEVGSNIDKRPVIILDIELGPHRLSKVPIALTDRSDKSTPVLVNRDILSQLGVVVAPDREFLLGESQEEVDTAKRLLDLGLMEPQDYKQKLRELGWDKRYRNQFVEDLEKLFGDLGLEWKNWATDRQQRNGTVLLKFSPADAAELIFTATVPPGLTPRQSARFQNIKARLLKVRREMEMDVEVRGRLAFEYWIFPGSFRPSGHFGEPTSSQTVNFDGSTDPQHSMARFLYQVALDADAKGWIWNPQHPHYNFARR